MNERYSQKAISLFSGTGGMDVGIEDAGLNVVFATDVDPVCTDSLRVNRQIGVGNNEWFTDWFRRRIRERAYRNWSEKEISNLRNRTSRALGRHSYLRHAIIETRDIRKLEPSEVMEACHLQRGDAALIAGGPPCQSFSRSGKRLSLEDHRGQLFMDFVRMIDHCRPRWFLFENVKGIRQTKTTYWSGVCRDCRRETFPPFREDRRPPSDSESAPTCGYCGSTDTKWIIRRDHPGGALEVIIAEFERLGYSCYSRLLDAVDFGAPQYRERCFIVGSRDNEPFAFPAPTHGPEPELALFPGQEKHVYRSVWDALFSSGSSHHGVVDPARAVLWLKNVVRPHDEPVTWPLSRPSPTIGAHQSAKLAIAPDGVPEEQLLRQQWHVLGRRQGHSPPVDVRHTYLSDEDLLKLQSFPDYWFVAGTRMERAFQIGNAVPPLLCRAVAAAMGIADDRPAEQKEPIPSGERGTGLSLSTTSKFPNNGHQLPHESFVSARRKHR